LAASDKSLPVLHIGNFNHSPAHHPDFYIETLEEHMAKYQFVQAPHRHDFYFMVLFTKGSGIHIIDFVSYEIRPGSLFFMSPAQVHSWRLSPADSGFVIFFNPAFYLLAYARKTLTEFPYFQPFTASPCLYLVPENLPEITALFEKIYDEFRGQEFQKENIIRSYLNILLIKSAGVYYAIQSGEPTSLQTSQIRKLEALIEQHYAQHLPVTGYAEMMQLSSKQLYAICQSVLQKSITDIIQDRLMLEAKRLLVHTELTISQIAARLNYTDNSYFNRFFKKMAGMTPEQFRKQFQKVP
jgi:AraC family transcriptional regulator, transcriptional activator of pobA